MEHFSTGALMRRLNEYAEFDASQRMREFLARVERKAAGYDLTREALSKVFVNNGHPLRQQQARATQPASHTSIHHSFLPGKQIS